MLQKGAPSLDQKPVVIRPWHEDMDLKADVTQVLVWIHFPSLPLKFWSDENPCRLTSQVGIPVDIDDLTLQKNRGQFARVQVLVDIKEEVMENVKFLDEHERVCEQPVSYEWMPVICKNCKAYGHRGKDCRKPKPQVWVPK